MHGELVPDETPLTKQERNKYSDYTEQIREGLNHFAAKFGTMCRIIRDERLYRENYATFEDYCKQEFACSASRIYQLIESAETVEMLTHVVEGSYPTSTPITERHARAISGLEDNVVADVVAKAVETCKQDEDGKAILTSAALKKARDEIVGDGKKQPRAKPQVDEVKKKQWEELSDLHQEALALLTKISSLHNKLKEEPHYSHVFTRAKKNIIELRAALYQHQPVNIDEAGKITTRIEERK